MGADGECWEAPLEVHPVIEEVNPVPVVLEGQYVHGHGRYTHHTHNHDHHVQHETIRPERGLDAVVEGRDVEPNGTEDPEGEEWREAPRVTRAAVGDGQTTPEFAPPDDVDEGRRVSRTEVVFELNRMEVWDVQDGVVVEGKHRFRSLLRQTRRCIYNQYNIIQEGLNEWHIFLHSLTSSGFVHTITFQPKMYNVYIEIRKSYRVIFFTLISSLILTKFTRVYILVK